MMARGEARSFRSIAVLALAAAAGLGAASLATPACEDAQTYVYSAQKYDPAGDCLAAYAPVETVNGPGASSTCAPLCLTVGEDLYVSTMCPPLPAIATAADADGGPCLAALAAQKRAASCDNPEASEASTDAEPEPEAGDDAAPEASEDASDDAFDAAPPKDAADAG